MCVCWQLVLGISHNLPPPLPSAPPFEQLRALCVLEAGPWQLQLRSLCVRLQHGMSQGCVEVAVMPQPDVTLALSCHNLNWPHLSTLYCL